MIERHNPQARVSFQGFMEESQMTFEEFVEYGAMCNPSSAAHHGGYAWSFLFNGCPVTHEDDNCYQITTPTGAVLFRRGDIIVREKTYGRITILSGQAPADNFIHHAKPIIETIAKWEAENGTLAAILLDEFKPFCEALSKVAGKASARAAMSALDEKEQDKPNNSALKREALAYEQGCRDTWDAVRGTNADMRPDASAAYRTCVQAAKTTLEKATLARAALFTPPSKADADDVEQIADTLTVSNILHAKSVGDLFGWVERLQRRIRALSAIQNRDAGLREALEKIANARSVMDGGSINECRRIARAALQMGGEKP